MSHSLIDQVGLPELQVSSTMRAAATSIAASFHAYQASCYSLPKARARGEIPANLQAQRERKAAYHLALKFLATATVKENPRYRVDAYPDLAPEDRHQLERLLHSYLDGRLNQLIAEQAREQPSIAHRAEHHPVMDGPW